MWVLIVVVVLCLFWTWHRLRYFSLQGVQTLPSVPFFGNLFGATLGRENFVDVIAAGYDKFKDQRYFGLYQYHAPIVVPRDPELIRQIMIRDFNSFTDRGIVIDQEIDPVFGKNLIMLRGSQWKEMRAALTPAFSAARSRSMAPLMDECAVNVSKHLHNLIGNGREIDTNKVTSPYINDVIASCAFGFCVNSLKEPNNAIYRLGQQAVVQHTSQIMTFFGYENFPSIMRLFKVKIIGTYVAEQFSKIFKSELKSRRENTAKTRPDFIQTLVDAAQGKLKHEIQDENDNLASTNWTKKFTDEDLVSQAVLFYVAGIDTTANLINYFLYEMAVNPEIQDKLQREVAASPEPDEANDLYEMVQGLEYLEMVVSEVLRLWPLVGAPDRRSVSRYDFGPTHEGSKHRLIIEPGIQIWLPFYCLHRDPDYWEEPNKCNPERFAPGNRSKIKPYTYLPFGTGPRHCIGSRFALLATKVLITRLMREFSVRPSPKTPTSQRIAPKAFVLRAADGFNLILEPRKL